MPDEVQSERATQPAPAQPTQRSGKMQRRKDARNPNEESARWHPAKWTETKLNRFTLHVLNRSLWEACQFLGEYEGNSVGAKIRSDYLEQKSVAMLKKKGVPLIGDTP